MESLPKSVSQPVPFPGEGRQGRSTAAAREKLAELRGLLAQKFPERQRAEGELLPTGLAAVDEALGGGVPQGALSEVVAAAPSSGGQLLIRSLLCTARTTHQHLGVVDGSDGLDPQSLDPELLPYLLWVRCAKVPQALQAADLLVRDGNLSLMLLDLRGNDARELRRQPPTIWFRLQRAVEQSGAVLVVLSAQPSVNSAAVRVVLSRPLPLESLDEPVEASVRKIEAEVSRGREGRMQREEGRRNYA